MAKKTTENQSDSRRAPQQARALVKIDFILEASRRILERDGLEGFTTTHVAELAGVSIGTLYQYFPDKQRILDELALRELGTLTQEVMSVVTSEVALVPGSRIRALLRAILSAYGGRTGVHAVLMKYLLGHGRDTPIPQLRTAIIGYMAEHGVVGANQEKLEVDEAQAFVLTHAVSGVLRGILNSPLPLEPAMQQAIEDSLVRLVLNYCGIAAEPPAA